MASRMCGVLGSFDDTSWKEGVQLAARHDRARVLVQRRLQGPLHKNPLLFRVRGEWRRCEEPVGLFCQIWRRVLHPRPLIAPPLTFLIILNGRNVSPTAIERHLSHISALREGCVAHALALSGRVFSGCVDNEVRRSPRRDAAHARPRTRPTRTLRCGRCPRCAVLCCVAGARRLAPWRAVLGRSRARGLDIVRPAAVRRPSRRRAASAVASRAGALSGVALRWRCCGVSLPRRQLIV